MSLPIIMKDRTMVLEFSDEERKRFEFIRNSAVHLEVYDKASTDMVSINDLVDFASRQSEYTRPIPDDTRVSAIESACQESAAGLKNSEILMIQEIIALGSSNICDKHPTVVKMFTSGFLKNYKSYISNFPDFKDMVEYEQDYIHVAAVGKQLKSSGDMSLDEAFEKAKFDRKKETEDKLKAIEKSLPNIVM